MTAPAAIEDAVIGVIESRAQTLAHRVPVMVEQLEQLSDGEWTRQVDDARRDLVEALKHGPSHDRAHDGDELGARRSSKICRECGEVRPCTPLLMMQSIYVR